MVFKQICFLLIFASFIVSNNAMENNALIKTKKEMTKIEDERYLWLLVGKVVAFESNSPNLCGDSFYELGWNRYGYIKEKICIDLRHSDPDYYTLIPLLKIEARGVCSGRLLTQSRFNEGLSMRYITSDEAHVISDAIKDKKAEFSRVYKEDPDFLKILQYLEYEKNKA